MPFVRVAFATALAWAALAAPAPAHAQEPPRFTDIRSLTNRETVLTLAATNGLNYRLDASTNLPAWAGFLTLTGVAPSLSITDAAAPWLPQRFYRAQSLTTAGVLTGDHVPTTNGEVIIHPVAHASFLMNWQGKMNYNDPTNAAAFYAGIPKADLILVSHSHGDHFNASTLDAVRNPNAVIIAPQTVCNSLSATLKSLTVVLTNGAATNLLGLRVEAVPATNSNHLPGVGNGYILTLGGARLYISGDTADIPPMRGLTNIEVAFVCMNTPFTMHYTNAASAVREFRPRIIYPYHYRNQDGTFADLNDFKRRVGQDLGIEVRLRKWY